MMVREAAADPVAELVRVESDTHVEKAAFALEQALLIDKQSDGAGERVEELIGFYMEAAQLFLKAIQNESEPAKKKELEGTTSGILSRVEAIKEKTALPSTGPTQPHSGKEPQPTRGLTTEEAAVLKHSSIINGHVCLPWLEADVSESFLSRGDALFTDKLKLGASDPHTDKSPLVRCR